MARFQYQGHVEPVLSTPPVLDDIEWYPEYPFEAKIKKRQQPFHLAHVEVTQNFPLIDVWYPEYPDEARQHKFKQERHQAFIEKFEAPVVPIEYWHPEFPDYFKPKSKRYLEGLYVRLFDTTAFVPIASYDGLIKISNIQVSLAVKREMDAGSGTANAADAAGTIFSFNKTFKDVESIVVTANSTTERICVVDFVDAPNPTTFKVYVFDKAGVRQTETIRWVARGIT